MSYLLPTSTTWVSASWQDHRDRTPPSSEPGTDYGVAYGLPVYAVDAGSVTYVKTSNSGAMGRVVEYRLDDGRDTRTLHLASVGVSVGQRIARGQTIGISGASGYGSDWYYGPHAHQTLWPGRAWEAAPIDFELYTGEDDDMPLTDDDIKRIWNYQIQPQDENGNYVPGSSPARGFLSNATANAQAAKRYAIEARDAARNVTITLTPEQVDAIAAQIAAALEGKVATEETIRDALAALVLVSQEPAA